MEKQLIKRLRAHAPVTFTVANTVTSGKVADALSALGVSPIMSVDPQEAADLVAVANAVVLNLGTPSKQLEAELQAAATAANETATPLVLDPVACGATSYRQQLAARLLNNYRFSVIRGNAGEIASLAGVDWNGHGIDAGTGKADLVAVAQQCAQRYQTTVVLSGPHDIITDGQQVLKNDRGTDWLAVNVGSGDILSSIIGALLATGADPLTAGFTGCRLVTTAGVKATKGTHGLGSWQQHFYDELTLIEDSDLE